MTDKDFPARVGSTPQAIQAGLLARVHLDLPLLIALLLLCGYGLLILFSAIGQDLHRLDRQLIRFGIASVVMVTVAQIPPWTLRRWSLPLFGMGLAMLVGILIVGDTGKGAQRWLDLGVVRFQPSELLKIAVP